MNKPKKILHKSLSLFVGTGLVAGNLFQLALPAFAGSLSITNEATGTYEDGNGNTNTTVSNKVVIEVTEVPGVEVMNQGISKADASGVAITGSVEPGSKIVATFDVLSKGNDPTKFFIPGVTELNADTNAVTNANVTKVKYQVKDAAGNDVGAAVEFTAGGANTVSSVPVGGKVVVTVLADVDSGAQPGDVIDVTLGNSAATPGVNETYVANGNNNDVYTVDNLDADNVPGEYLGAAATVKEASNKQSITVNAIPKPFVKIEKTYGTYTENTPAGPENDVLEYNLQVTVPSTKPIGFSSQIATDDLYPTYVNGLSDLHVLISDVLPTGTKLESFVTSPPAGWTAVYSEDTDLTKSAYEAQWKLEAAVTNINNVTRVGYVYTANTKITKSDTAITGFSFKIKLGNTIVGGTSLYNLAEVFGEENGTTPTSTTKPTVYDESGDTTYNNDSDGNGTPDTPVENTTGVPDLTNDPGTDPNTNTGTGTSGEPNEFPIPLKGILNGTVDGTTNHPDATGPGNDNNKDFTNAAAAVTPTVVPGVTFTNSVRNTSNTAKDVKVVILASDLTDLPVGITTIKVMDPGDATKTVTYTVTQGSVGGTPTITDDKGGVPLTFTGVAATNGEARYTVEVDLPDDAGKNTGYDVPVTAFVGSGNTPATDDPKNVTIDRVYTGFITLLKESRVLDSTGAELQAFSTASKTANTGERIEYRVTYTNISETGTGGANNVLLVGKNLKITEDGVPSGSNTNNWAGVTGHIQTTATNTTTEFDISFFDGTTTLGADPATDATVTKYESTLQAGQSIDPQETGSFQFQRSIK